MIPKDAITISVFRDGNKYCAVFTDSFENLQKSLAGFGATEKEAVINLLDNREAVLHPDLEYAQYLKSRKG